MSSSWSALRYPHFRRFLAANGIAAAGQFLQAVAVPVVMLDLVGGSLRENTWVAGAGFVALGASVIVTPISGTLADRVNRKHLMMVAYAVQILSSSLLILLFTTDRLTPWLILLCQMGVGIGSGFTFAPMQSMSAVLVDPDALVSAVRCIAISFTAGRAIGPLMGGLALWIGGPGLAISGTLVAYILALVMILSVTIRETEPSKSQPFVQQLVDGFTYVRRRSDLRNAIVLASLVATFSTKWPSALAASVAVNGFDASDAMVGLVIGIYGVGSLSASVWFTKYGDRRAPSFHVRMAACGFLLGLILMASTPYLAVAAVGFLVLGMAQVVNSIVINTSLQLKVNEEYRGRVMSVWLVAVLGGLPIGAIMGGIVADLLSVRLAMGVDLVILTAILAFMYRKTEGFVFLDQAKADTV